MNRNRAYHRFQRRRAIHHKKIILRDYWRCNDSSFWNPTRIGALDKGKVHCSCWMCRRKSYDDPSISDKRKYDSVNQLIQLYMDQTDHI